MAIQSVTILIEDNKSQSAYLGREKVRNELAKIEWPAWVVNAAGSAKDLAIRHGLYGPGGLPATGAGAAAATGARAAATTGARAVAGRVVTAAAFAVTAKGWLAIALTTVLLAAATIAVGETIKWIRKPAAEPAAAVTKPAEPQPNDALEPNQWSDSYKKKGLISDIEEFVTPQTPATSDGQTPQTPATSGGGSRGTGSSQAPAGNVQAPTGTSEGESGIQIAAAPVETPSETPSESPSATPSETPLPPDPGGEGSGEGGGGGGGSGAAKHEPPAGVGDSTKIAAAPPATEQHTQPPPDDSSMGGTHHPT